MTSDSPLFFLLSSVVSVVVSCLVCVQTLSCLSSSVLLSPDTWRGHCSVVEGRCAGPGHSLGPSPPPLTSLCLWHCLLSRSA